MMPQNDHQQNGRFLLTDRGGGRRGFTLIYSFSLTLACMLFILVVGCAGPSEKAPPTPPADNYELEVSSQATELQIDGVSSTDITIRAKKNGSYLSSLPNDWSIYAYHTHSGSTLIIPEQDPNIYSGNFNGTLSIIEISPLSVGLGIPVKIKCQVNSDLLESGSILRLEIRDSAGNVVYTDDEYANKGFSDYEFNWNGWGTSSTGSYPVLVRLGKLNNSGQFEEKAHSDSVPMYIKGNIGAFETSIPYVSGKVKLVMTSPSNAEHRESDNIIVKLKNESGAEMISNFSNQLKVTFIIPSLYHAQADAIPPFVLNCTLDGKPAMVSFPGTGGSSSSIIEVAVYKGDSTKQITYQFNMSSKEIKIITKAGETHTLTFGSDEYDDAGYIIVDLINKIIEEGYLQAGISRDSSGNISISKKLGNFSISSWDSGDIRNYKLSGTSGVKYYFEYDKTASTLKASKGFNLETSYSIDTNALDVWLASLGNYASLPELETGVAAATVWAGMSPSDVQELVGLTVIASTWLYKTMKTADDILSGKFLTETLYPKEYVGPVEITYGYPKDENFSALKRLDGTAPPYKAVEVYRSDGTYINSKAANYKGEWSINTDNGDKEISLYNGENKFKAVVRHDGCEVESGEITIYKGNQKFALTSPADRQVVWGDFVDAYKTKLYCKISVRGYAEKGKALKVKMPDGTYSPAFYADDNWEFKDDGNLYMSLNESENQIEVVVDGKPITKTIIAAYRFENTSVSKKYILRKGDMLFCSKNDSDFDVLPKEPDHTGIYVGNRNVSETWRDNTKGVWMHDLLSPSGNQDFLNNRFYYAAQPRKVVGESLRNKAVENAAGYSGDGTSLKTPYDMPFASAILNSHKGQKYTGNCLGHYDGATNGFYCSELTYYVWEQAAKQLGKNIVSDVGMDRGKMMWPFSGANIVNDNISGLLPAKLGKELMECRKLGWNE